MLYNQFGYYALMRNTERQWERQMKESILRKLQNKDLIEISLTDNLSNIIWEDDDQHEFTLRDELYDVVRKITKNGRTFLLCLNDKKEKQLIKRYNDVTKQNHSSEKKAKRYSSSLIQLYFLEKPATINRFSSWSGILYQSFSTQLLTGINTIDAPPPKA